MPEFHIQRCLGRGGFGEVYKGVMSRGGGVEVDVAIKVLRPDLEPASQGVQRLRDEGRLLGRLTHPTILRVYDLVVFDGRAALISEYVAGADLARLLREERIPPRAVFEAIAQVAAALDAAWSWPSVTDGKPLHLVHRDIKPDNIRIDPHGVVKLLDFGIAQAQTVHREAQTSVNTIMGSTQYLAPERLVQQEVGPESDVFALGCSLFEALAGEALFARRSMRQMYVLMVEERRFEQFLAERCAIHAPRLGTDRALALIRAMTSWRKQNRPTAAEVAARCDTISDGTDGPTLTQWCRTRTWPPPPTIAGPLDGVRFTVSQNVEEAAATGPASRDLANRDELFDLSGGGRRADPVSRPLPESEDHNRAPVLGAALAVAPWIEVPAVRIAALGLGFAGVSAAEVVAMGSTRVEPALRIPVLLRQEPLPPPNRPPNGPARVDRLAELALRPPDHVVEPGAVAEAAALADQRVADQRVADQRVADQRVADQLVADRLVAGGLVVDGLADAPTLVPDPIHTPTDTPEPAGARVDGPGAPVPSGPVTERLESAVVPDPARTQPDPVELGLAPDRPLEDQPTVRMRRPPELDLLDEEEFGEELPTEVSPSPLLSLPPKADPEATVASSRAALPSLPPGFTGSPTPPRKRKKRPPTRSPLVAWGASTAAGLVVGVAILLGVLFVAWMSNG
ncbi:MAG: serine/threonine-protein kinase [Myxococcota bacterium]